MCIDKNNLRLRPAFDIVFILQRVLEGIPKPAVERPGLEVVLPCPQEEVL